MELRTGRRRMGRLYLGSDSLWDFMTALKALLTSLRTFREDGGGEEEESILAGGCGQAAAKERTAFPFVDEAPIINQNHGLVHLRDFRCPHQARFPPRRSYSRHSYLVSRRRCSHLWPRLYRSDGPGDGPDSPDAVPSFCRYRDIQIHHRHRRPSTFSFLPLPVL